MRTIAIPRRRPTPRAWHVPACLALLAAPAAAQDVFRSARLDELGLVAEEAAPDAPPAGPSAWSAAQALVPRAVLDGEGEAWLLLPEDHQWRPLQALLAETRIVARTPSGAPARGRVFLADPERAGAWTARFDLEAVAPTEEARAELARAAARHYELLRARAVPGGAWFRHRERELRSELGTEPIAESPAFPQPPPDGLDGSFELFTGGHAVAENLQLDRELAVTGGAAAERTVDVAAIPGIEVAAIDWGPLVEGRTPARDELAGWIPEDQHAVLFPSFGAFVEVLDESERHGTPVLDLFEPRSEDAGTRERYERQLCLGLDLFARTMGPQAVERVALTGSDPYLRTGTDVAVLLAAAQPEAVAAFVRARHAEAAGEAAGGVERVGGKLGTRAYEGVRSADRAISSYLVVDGRLVLVTNSLAQAERLLAARDGALPRLADAPEMTFFRDRYPVETGETTGDGTVEPADGRESAFLILTDATIRRWCGPRWRIGASRRTRALAELLEQEAASAAGILAGDAVRAQSPEYGTTLFQTPILELDLARATKEEEAAYLRFRSRYQASWREIFDPIAARLSLSRGRVSLDLTVMPLIVGSDYRDLVDLTRGGELAPGAGDPHAGALLHWVMALDPDGATLREWGGFVGGLSPDLSDPFSWVGGEIAFYADQDPFWQEFAAAAEPWDFAGEELHRLPLALHVGVQSPLRLAAFLTAVRGFSEQAAPGMLRWENSEHGGRTYVRIVVSDEFAGTESAELAICYAVTPTSLVLTLSEPLLQRALERAEARRTEAVAPERPWLGRHLGLRLEQGVLELLPLLERTAFDRQRLRSWDNLPILNEWRRLFPDRDPREVHRTLFRTLLVCPGGGEYVWNDELATMESTVFGCPERPREGAWRPAVLSSILDAELGLSFEHGGLRARAVLHRE